MKTTRILTTGFALVVMATVVLVSSCKKEDKKDTTTPANAFSLTISSPEEGKVFTNGSTVNVKATVSNDTEMHGYELKIKNTSNNDEIVFTKTEEHNHSKTYTIDESWVNNVTMHSDMEAEITVYIDHDGTTKTQHVHFHCHP